MISIATGYSPKYLTDEVAAGRENYYTGAVADGEPPGRWYGRGAEKLGLSGLVDTQDMTALYEHFVDPRDEGFRDPARWETAATLGHRGRKYRSEEQLYAEAIEREPNASAERRTELRLEAGKRAQKNVAFLDATFSVQKSITVLHTAFEAKEVNARTAGDTESEAAWARHREAVEAAIWEGNRAALDYLADHAGYSRVGHHGGAAGRYVDAHDWTIASFFQHDNRDHDPQLHIHNAILNRAQGPDGQWRTLDSRAIHKFRAAAGAVAERVTEEHLTAALGVRFAARPDGKAREVVGIDGDVMDLFSSRRRAVTRKTAELADAFETKFGRAPNSLELDRLSRQATLATRRAKSHEGETREQMLERWDRSLRAEIQGGLAKVADGVLDLHQEQPATGEFSPVAVLETALADVQSRKSAWTAPDLTRAISDALPDHLATERPEQVVSLLDRLTAEGLKLATPLDADRPGDENLPAVLRVDNGRSAYEAPAGRRYATPEHVHTERVLATATLERDMAALPANAAGSFLETLAGQGIELGADQAAAVRGVLSSGARVESLIGPAGTGKSFVVGALAQAWADTDLWGGGPGRRVFGLAASQKATDVLAGEGVAAANITRWLGIQDRLADAPEGTHSDERSQWGLKGGDMVVIDESAMTNTADLAAVHRHARKAGAKLLLVGDHRQLAAVGAGGGMELLADTGASYELADVRRFHQEWERAASLRLRAGDESVLDEYHRHGRLVDGGAQEQAEESAMRAYLADTLDGKHSVLLVDSNEQAARVSARVRAELVRLGRVDEAGVPLADPGSYAGVGDLVQARKNAWGLAGYKGNRRGPINRENYRVLATGEDGSVTVAPILGHTAEGEQWGAQVVLPADYVGEHLALGYAATGHAAQGATVDTSHVVATPGTSAEALYVGLTRGRERNTVHTVTRSAPEDAEIGETAESVHRSPAGILATTLETADPTKTALATATEATAENDAIRTPAELLADAVELATAGRTVGWLDELTADGMLTESQRARLAAEDGAASLTRVLRRAELAGHDPRQVLEDAVTDRSLSGARQLTSIIHNRITNQVDLDPHGDSYRERLPQVADPEWQRYLDSLATKADDRALELGRATAAEGTQWAVEALGPVPQDMADREQWVKRAGLVAAHRELSGHEDPGEALGATPKAGQAEAYASWRAAWRALGRPEADRDELEMSDGQLRVRMRAADREAAWAPRYVGNELAGTTQAAAAQRRTATLRAAEAEAATDEATRAQLRQKAAEATALADTLDGQVERLREVETARGHWLTHTAATREAAARATAELSARRAAHELDPEDQPVTAAEWLAAHDEHTREEDQHRDITADYELTTEPELGEATEHAAKAKPEIPAEPETPARDETPAEPGPDKKSSTADAGAAAAGKEQDSEKDRAAEVDTGPTDIRDLAADEEPERDEDKVRVPSQDETTAAVERAQRALAEIRAREAEERAQRDEQQREQQLAQWHQADQAAEAEQAAAAEAEEPGLS